jgi:hypothetical protein
VPTGKPSSKPASPATQPFLLRQLDWHTSNTSTNAVVYGLIWPLGHVLGYVMDRCAPTQCIEPFGRLMCQVLAHELSHFGRRLYWILDYGSPGRDETAKHWLHQVNSHIFVVHTPVRASCLPIRT